MGMDSILHKVEYTDDEARLLPTVSEGNDMLSFGEFGTVKHSGWGFQREWRYLLRIFPPDSQLPRRSLLERLPEVFEQIKAGTLGSPCRYYDLMLDPGALSTMEIVLSPEMSPGNRVLFEALKERYCPMATVIPSELSDTL